jgi:hypothetical protein
VATTVYKRTEVGEDAWRTQNLPPAERSLLTCLRKSCSIEELNNVWSPLEEIPVETVLTQLLQKGWVRQEVRDDIENVPPDAQKNEDVMPSYLDQEEREPQRPPVVPLYDDDRALLIAMGVIRAEANEPEPVRYDKKSAEAKKLNEKNNLSSSAPTIQQKNSSTDKSNTESNSGAKSSKFSLLKEALGEAGAEEAARAAARARAEAHRNKVAREQAEREEKRAVDRSYLAVDQSKTVVGLSERLKRLREEKNK